ncbi:MAG: hypothetical protein ACK5NB_07990 [Flavobacteriaceae bacterium]
MRIDQVKSAMDVLAGFELLTQTEQKQTLLTVIDTLGGYPKPTKKQDERPAPVKDVGAYLFVSNSRNACKLGELGYIETRHAYNLVSANLETALSLLLG